MRDLINLIEANLATKAMTSPEKLASAINPKTGEPYTRHQLFLKKILDKSPFTLVKGGEVILDPREYTKAKAWLAAGALSAQKFNTIDGNEVSNTQLQKTVEFGSSEKETIPLKGSDIFNASTTSIADVGNSIQDILKAGGFPANEMFERISENPNLKKLGAVGRAIKDMASHIMMGTSATVPKGLSATEVKAIELYASEYLAVLGLLTGATTFKQGNREDFDEFLGTNLNDMIMYFPKDQANPLADSFSVVNDANGHALKISSKAAGKGAAPSLGSLKVPKDVKKKYPEFYEFYEIANDESYTMFEQPFILMNWLQEKHPNTIPKAYEKMMPFDEATIQACQTSFKTKKPMAKGLFGLFAKRLGEKVLNNNATDGGKAWYAVCADLVSIVNDGKTIKNLREGIIESLGYNFIQVYSNIKGDTLVSEAFWPAKIHGQAKVKSKGYADNPNYGRLSFEIGSADAMGTDPETGNDTPAKKSPPKPKSMTGGRVEIEPHGDKKAAIDRIKGKADGRSEKEIMGRETR